MKTEQISESNLVDKGGVFDIAKQKTKLNYNGTEWTYVASGLVRDVFRSECGKSVIKIPKNKYRFDHNILEWECYRDAPDWCKEYIAKTALTEENFIIQEYVKVNPDAGNFFREVGTRESDGKIVIFDCDIFLDHKLQKPESGFKYQQTFSKSSVFGEAYIKAKELPKELRRQQRAERNKYFPDLDNQSYRQTGDAIYIDDVEATHDIATKCGFTYESRLGYDD